MTPEQILIDGLKYINTYDLAGDDAFADCTLRQRAWEFLRAYKKAKASEAQDQDLLEKVILRALANIYSAQKAWGITDCTDDEPVNLDWRVEIFLRGVQKRFDELEGEIAKAKKATTGKLPVVQDLLTASPDRAALLTASPLADACEIALSVLQDVDGTSPEYDAIQYAIAQSDELIDHSKKVWDLLRVRRDTHGLKCVFYEGEKHCNCGLDEYTEIKESLPDDILVLMEVGNDDY